MKIDATGTRLQMNDKYALQHQQGPDLHFFLFELQRCFLLVHSSGSSLDLRTALEKERSGRADAVFMGSSVRNEPPLASEFVTVHAFVQTFDLLVASAHGSKKNLKQCWTNRDERRGITAVVPYR